jgi:activator of HSP90 ATPase
LPTKDSSGNLKEQEKKSTPTNTKPSHTNPLSVNNKSGQINGDTSKIKTKSLSINDEFKCRINELYQVFTDINVYFLKILLFCSP